MLVIFNTGQWANRFLKGNSVSVTSSVSIIIITLIYCMHASENILFTMSIVVCKESETHT